MKTKEKQKLQIPMSEFVASVTDGTHDTPRRQPSGRSLITSKHLKNGTILPTDYFITEEDFEEVNRRSKVDQWDVLVSMIGTVGELVLVDREPDFAIKNIGLIKCGGNETLGRFVYYYLLSSVGHNEIKQQLGGTSQSFISLGGLRSLSVSIPENLDTKAVSNILGSFDTKIENNNKIIKTLEEMAQAIFKEWFVNFKFPGHEKVEFIDSPMGKIPSGWECGVFLDIATLNKGVSYTSAEINGDEAGAPLINLATFQRGGGFNLSGIKKYTGGHKSTHVVVPGQIVVAMTDLTSNREVIGHPARVPSDLKEAIISLDVCSVGTDEIYVEYLYHLMLRKSFAHLMASSASGTNVSHLSKKFIENHKIVIPTKQVLELFASQVKPLFEAQGLLESENRSLITMRDLLLPKLMSGEIEAR